MRQPLIAAGRWIFSFAFAYLAIRGLEWLGADISGVAGMFYGALFWIAFLILTASAGEYNDGA